MKWMGMWLSGAKGHEKIKGTRGKGIEAEKKNLKRRELKEEDEEEKVHWA